MIGSHFHLSRPLISFLAILNVGSSWLSREIVFSVLFLLSTLLLLYMQWFVPQRVKVKEGLGWLAVVLGWVCVYSMGSIYLIPSQPVWDSSFTLLSFFATTLLLGLVTFPLITVLQLTFLHLQHPEQEEPEANLLGKALNAIAPAVLILAIAVIVLNGQQLRSLSQGPAAAQAGLGLLLGPYRALLTLRLAAVLIGAAVLCFVVVRAHRQVPSAQEVGTPLFVACLFVLLGEILGRFLFYATHVRVGI
jgi:anaerobic dimethyl sulfoxide reductase subunit C (anchor subunit)